MSAAGLEVVPRDLDGDGAGAQWTLTLSTSSFGRVGDATDLDSADVHATQQRVEIDHVRLTEWFVNDERGVEQGWTIPRPPPGVGLLWIGLQVGGDLNLRIDAGSRSGVFVDASGEPRLRYTGLMAFDATGCELDARLTPSPSGLGIAIDDSGAVYPLTVDPFLTGPAWTAESDQASARFGSSVASAGDVNGDGYSDVIVGAYQYDNGETDEGRAFVYLGSSAGLSTGAAWTAESDQELALFGWSVATAGDVNGDGYSDVIVGAYGYDNDPTFDEGRAYVYLGSSSGLSSSPAWTGEGDQYGANFGYSVATAGDVNGDGYSDVIVGSSLYNNFQTDEGRAFVYLGASTGLSISAAWTAESDQAHALFGYAVAAAGDVNSDGYGDVIVGARMYDNGQPDEGRAYVYLGSGAGLSASAAWTAEGNQDGALFGHAVAAAGDVNGDGYSDVIVGAFLSEQDEADEGRAFLYYGSGTGLWTSAAWIGEIDQDSAWFGTSVATAGDVNGDGYSDVIVGATGHDNGETDEGRAFMFLGSATGLEISAAWTAESDQTGATFGSSVATAGDVNGDGYSDLIVGASLNDNGQTDEGRAFVYMGSSSTLAAAPIWTAVSAQPNGPFTNFQSAGDVNGDGYSDVIVGAPAYSTSRGRAFVYMGSGAGLSPSFVWSVESNQLGSELGDSVAAAGDVNGDGYGDVIVGAPEYDGEPDEGLAFVYLGSSTGLSTQAAWTGESNESGAEFGSSVASAGDVNGDGYSDVIVSAPLSGASPNVGRMYVYHGSKLGLAASAASIIVGVPQSGFGHCIASAGDVNGDGYSDVIVGAYAYDNYVGSAYVYLGSATGLSTGPAWSAESNQASAYFGVAVASAGDVNGDGYSDVIVGSNFFHNGEASEGAAFVYLGSSAGLSTIASWTAESNQASTNFGYAVASAGDVNGDGYSDLLVGASSYDNGQNGEGRAFLYLGSSTGPSNSAAWTVESNQTFGGLGRWVAPAGDANGDGFADVLIRSTGASMTLHLGNGGRGGWMLTPQQRQSSDVTPIQLLGRSGDKFEFRIHLAFARTLAGFTWASGFAPMAKLEWEVQPLFVPLDGSDVHSGVAEPVDDSLLRFNELVAFTDDGAPLSVGIGHHAAARSTPYHWRARVRTNNPLFPVTPWVTIPGNNVTETKLRAGPLRTRRDPP